MLLRSTFLSFLSLCLIDNLQAQGDIVSFSHIGSYSKAAVDSMLNNFGAPSYLIPPRFDVDVYKVVYETPNAQGTGTTIASGALAVPAGVQCPLPMLAYQHGTTSQRYDVPSYGSAEMRLGVIFASAEGYVVSMADYLGLGDSPGFHPYVHAKSEATAGLDLLRAISRLQDSLSFNLNGQLFLFGYSQGGHGAMSLFREIQTLHSNEFQVTAAAPMSGPYDISGVQAQTITDTAYYSSPGYLPYVIMGYQEAYGNLYTDLSDVFKAPYDSLLPILFDGTRSFGYINNQVPDTPNQMILGTVFQDFLNNPNNPMRLALQDNDVYDWRPESPTRMLYCTQDEQVFYQNSLVALDRMVQNGSTMVEAISMGNFDHGGCLQGCMFNAKAFFREFADWAAGMTVSSSASPATNFGTPNGSAQVQPSGGQAPYSYEWNTGATTAQLSNVLPGFYTVRVSDARGCFVEYDVQVPALSSASDLAAAQSAIRIAPNPASGLTRLELDPQWLGRASLWVRDMLGRIVFSMPTLHTETVLLDVNALPSGIYMVELQGENGTIDSQKLQVKP